MFRKTISITSFLSFVVLFATSIVLYFEPHGRIAFWADWSFLGLSKEGWDEIHITVGVLFMVAGVLHIWLNWKPMMAYLKNKARQMVVMTKPMVVSLIITLFFVFGTLWHLPPMQQILDFSGYLKDSHTERYGNPPYGHAELSPLEKFCYQMRFDLDDSLAALEKAAIKVDSPEQTLQEIGRKNDISPADVFVIIRNELGGEDPFSLLPESTPEGFGKMKLNDLFSQYGLPAEPAMKRLADAGIPGTPDQTIKEIAADNDKMPIEVYNALRGQTIE